GQGRRAVVVAVEQRLAQQVRAGDGELQRVIGESASPAVIARKVERSFADGAFDDAGNSRAEAHAGKAGEFLELLPAGGGADAGEGPDEVIDHAVRVGVVDVEAVKLSVGDDVDS